MFSLITSEIESPTHQGSGLNIELHTSRQVDLQVSMMLATVFAWIYQQEMYEK